MTELLGILVAGGGVTALTYWLISLQNASLRRQEDVWRRAAQFLQGSFTPRGTALFSPSPMCIRATVDGVGVTIDHYTVSNGKTSTTYTRLSARAEGPRGLMLAVYEEGLFSSIGKALGTQDVVVGDRAFDEFFMVKASEEDLARAWLVEPVTRLLRAVPSYSHRLQEGALKSTRVGIEDHVDTLLHAARASARLAGRGVALREEWGSLARALGAVVRAEPWAEEPRMELDERGSTIMIDLTREAPAPGHRHARLVSRVRAARGKVDVETFVVAPKGELSDRDGALVALQDPRALSFEVRSSDTRMTAARFNAEVVEALGALGGLYIKADEDEVSASFLGIVLDRAKLRAAAGIVVQLAAQGGVGPYR